MSGNIFDSIATEAPEMLSPAMSSPPGKQPRPSELKAVSPEGARSRSDPPTSVALVGAKRLVDALAAGPAPVAISSPVTHGARSRARSERPTRARSQRPTIVDTQQAIIDQSPKKVSCDVLGIEELRSWAVNMFIQQNESLMKLGHAADADRDRIDRLWTVGPQVLELRAGVDA